MGYFDEHVEYDANGNIVRLRRGGLTDNMHGGFGLVDDLYMTYTGNMLTSVRDDATHAAYAAATDFHTESRKKSYPLTYNGAGSLVSDAGRNIARIDYDRLNNPVRIQFTNGSVTRYVYSATGEKLRTVHLTAVPNISVPTGGSRELAPSENQPFMPLKTTTEESCRKQQKKLEKAMKHTTPCHKNGERNLKN